MARGRRPDPTLAPSRQLLTQRAFRQRRAEHLAEMQRKIETLEEENRKLSEGLSRQQAHFQSHSDTTPGPSVGSSLDFSKRARRGSMKSEDAFMPSPSRSTSGLTQSASNIATSQASPGTEAQECHRCQSYEETREEIDAVVLCVGNCLSKLQNAINTLQTRVQENPSPDGVSQHRGSNAGPLSMMAPPQIQASVMMNEGDNNNSANNCSSICCSQPTSSSAKQSTQVRHSDPSSSSMTTIADHDARARSAQTDANNGQWGMQNANISSQGQTYSTGMSSQQAQGSSFQPNATREHQDINFSESAGEPPKYHSRSMSMSQASPWAAHQQSMQSPFAPHGQWSREAHAGQIPYLMLQHQHRHPNGPSHNAQGSQDHLQSQMLQEYMIPNMTLPMQLSQASATPGAAQSAMNHNSVFSQAELSTVEALGGDARKCCLGFFDCDTDGSSEVRVRDDGTRNFAQMPRDQPRPNTATS